MITSLRPALMAWAGRHEDLRGITREQVLAHVATLRGDPRHVTMSALRSLFGRAARHGIVFRDPTSRIVWA